MIVWIYILILYKLSSIGQTFGAKNLKKHYHVNILEGIVYWVMTSNLKAEETNFNFQQIVKFLDAWPMAIVWSTSKAIKSWCHIVINFQYCTLWWVVVDVVFYVVMEIGIHVRTSVNYDVSVTKDVWTIQPWVCKVGPCEDWICSVIA